MRIPAWFQPRLRFQAVRMDPDPDGSLRVRIYHSQQPITKGRNYPGAPEDCRPITPETVEIYAPHKTQYDSPTATQPELQNNFQSDRAAALSRFVAVNWRALAQPSRYPAPGWAGLVQHLAALLKQSTLSPVIQQNCLQTLETLTSQAKANYDTTLLSKSRLGVFTWALPHYQLPARQGWLLKMSAWLIRKWVKAPDYLELYFQPSVYDRIANQQRYAQAEKRQLLV